MAAIEERSGRFRIHFRWHGKQQKLALGQVSAEEAASKAAQIDYLLMRLKQRLIELPPDVDIAEFVVLTPVPGPGRGRYPAPAGRAVCLPRFLYGREAFGFDWPRFRPALDSGSFRVHPDEWFPGTPAGPLRIHPFWACREIALMQQTFA